MTWTRLSDDFNDRPALLVLSRSARLLHVEALVYGNRLLTDGEITRTALVRFTDSTDVDGDIRELVAVGLWSELEGGRLGWQIQNWAVPAPRGEAQEARQVVEKRQEENRLKQERYRKHHAGDHSICLPRRCKYAPKAGLTGYETRNGTGQETKSETGSLTPSRPGPKGQRPGRTCPHGYPVVADDTSGCPDCLEQQQPSASIRRRPQAGSSDSEAAAS